ncbi:MAG: hypothetical protein HY430_00465 [Candidatus Levybacteria bacterium]|nr:hypothetical protein [Candidatus Levybacteria bacterium]
MKNKNIYLIVSLVILSAVGFVSLNSLKNETTNQAAVKQELVPADSITHGHGLSVDVADPKKVYIATHHGLMVLTNDKELYQVGDKKDDYMGFSPHPSNSKIFFSSGHPESGGNIGFQKSIDGGFTWKKVSDGVNGPVDFHAMAVSPANPNMIYGWFQGALQRSVDEGKSWEVASTTNFPVVNLSADPKNENVVYAASPQGLMVSRNKGKDWSRLLDGFVSTVTINPEDSQKMLSFSEKNGLARSNDAGKTWEKSNASFSGETPLFLSFAKQKPDIVYILTEKNSIYKSINSGMTWNKVR